MVIVTDQASNRKRKSRVALTILTILIVFPIVVIEDAGARGIVTANGADSSTVGHLAGASSGMISPLFETELRNLPTVATSVIDQGSPVLRSPRALTSSGANSFGAAASATQSSSSISLLSSFDGLNQIQSCACVPPDVQIATGPSRIVEMVNLEGEIFTKQGVFNQTFSLSAFFRTGSDSISDPKVLFDAGSGRWFASLVDITTNSVRLGVSSTNDPAGQWVFYSLSAGSVLPDQPILGFSDDKVAVAANDFSGNTFVGSQFWVLNKSQLLAGITTAFFTPGSNSGEFSIHPVQSLSSTTTQYMVSGIVSRKVLSTTSLRLYTVTGIPGVSTVNVVTNNLSVSTIGTLSGGVLPGGVQPGTSATIDTADIRIQTAVWYKGVAWIGLDDACTPTGDTQLRSCIRLTKIATNTLLVSQDFDFGARLEYSFYPALSVDNNGNLMMTYGYSNATIFPSLAITGQLTTDPMGSMAMPRTLKIGTAADTSTRYGDYFGAALDPSDPSIIWVAGEYHNSSTGSCQSFGSCWSTLVGSASMTGFTISASPSSIRLSAVSAASSNVSFTSVNGFVGLVSTNSSKSNGITVSPAQPVNLTSGSPATIKLSFTVLATTSLGNYSVTVTGSNGNVSRVTNLLLTVFPDYNITFACSCHGATALPGALLREDVTLVGVNGFTGIVGLKPALSPLVSGGPSLSLNQANQTLTQGGSAVVALMISSGNVPGTFTITVTGSCLSGSCVSPAQQHSINLSLTVISSTSSGGGGGRHLLV